MPNSETLGEGFAAEPRFEHDLPQDAVATSSTATTIAVTILAGVRRRINERHIASTALMGSPPESISAMMQPGSDLPGAAGGAAATGELHGITARIHT
ncbi:MAG: hypothetical protein M3Q90_00470 [Candidatus Dormibacteraeota bacterium]|nr:hypothetical protein [Candidatus Dormibacteraeota bacterium]